MRNHLAKMIGISLSALLWMAHMLYMPLNNYGYAVCTLLTVLMVTAGIYVDSRTRKIVLQGISHDLERIHPTLVYAMQHVLNNFISGMELMRMEAQSCKGFDRQVLDLYDESLRESVQKIQKVADAKDFTQAGIWQQLYPDINNPHVEDSPGHRQGQELQ